MTAFEKWCSKQPPHTILLESALIGWNGALEAAIGIVFGRCEARLARGAALGILEDALRSLMANPEERDG